MTQTSICTEPFLFVNLAISSIVAKYKGFETVVSDNPHACNAIKTIQMSETNTLTLCYLVNFDERMVVIRLIKDDQHWIKFQCNWSYDGTILKHVHAIYTCDVQSVIDACPDEQLRYMLIELNTELQNRQLSKLHMKNL